MMKILFEHSGKAYLPEIAAYQSYIEKHYNDWTSVVSTLSKPISPHGFDVVWRFPGLDLKSRSADNQIIVQDYNSLSTGHFPKLKNKIKKSINIKPDARVFLNQMVCDEFDFEDQVPSFIRDMGVSAQFFDVELEPEYDFVYAGKVNRGPEVLNFLRALKNNPELSLLLIGEVDDEVKTEFKGLQNISFTGRVDYALVPKYLARGKYGLNLMPDNYPYSKQTATKVLEYCALGLQVVSNKYEWIEKFSKENQAHIFWVEPDFANISRTQLECFEFKTPDVSCFHWDRVIKDSGIFEFLSKHI